mgnify:CR=1 FL=1
MNEPSSSEASALVPTPPDNSAASPLVVQSRNSSVPIVSWPCPHGCGGTVVLCGLHHAKLVLGLLDGNDVSAPCPYCGGPTTARHQRNITDPVVVIRANVGPNRQQRYAQRAKAR